MAGIALAAALQCENEVGALVKIPSNLVVEDPSLSSLSWRWNKKKHNEILRVYEWSFGQPLNVGVDLAVLIQTLVLYHIPPSTCLLLLTKTFRQMSKKRA